MMPVLLSMLLLFGFGKSDRPKVGEPAPDFEAKATGGKTIRLSDLRGQWVVLYFYPKAFTPGCTTEACTLRDAYEKIRALGAVILGVSLDNLETQERFKAKYNLPFDLISDQDKKIARAYDVLGMGGLYAKRVTFLIDPEGRIAHIFEKVDPARHDREVYETLKQLQESRKS
ncbi:MAG: peroxiredoxin [Rhodothermus sp.]|nr:peroxiredoxin [Rhodothermus sp.]